MLSDGTAAKSRDTTTLFRYDRSWVADTVAMQRRPVHQRLDNLSESR
jgi:hypothetical protein